MATYIYYGVKREGCGYLYILWCKKGERGCGYLYILWCKEERGGVTTYIYYGVKRREGVWLPIYNMV